VGDPPRPIHQTSCLNVPLHYA